MDNIRNLTMASELACHRIMVMGESTVRDSKNCMVEHRYGIMIRCMVEHKYGIMICFMPCILERHEGRRTCAVISCAPPVWVRPMLQRSIVEFVQFSPTLTLLATESRDFARVWAFDLRLVSDLTYLASYEPFVAQFLDSSVPPAVSIPSFEICHPKDLCGRGSSRTISTGDECPPKCILICIQRITLVGGRPMFCAD